MTHQAPLRRIIGVYDADGTITGELAYLFRRSLRGEHCALCDITHGRLRERADWRDVRTQLPVPFVTFHRNDQPAEVRAATAGQAPVVVGEYEDGRIEVLLDETELDACNGEPQQLIDRVVAVTRPQ